MTTNSHRLFFDAFEYSRIMSSSLSKILETGIKVFKSNSQIIKNKNTMKYQLYTNASKNYRWLLATFFSISRL